MTVFHNLWGRHTRSPGLDHALGAKRRVQTPPDFKVANRGEGFDVSLNGQTKGAYGEKKETHQPTHDQLYLASRINDAASSRRLTPAALQKLNSRYGVTAVSFALRSLRGFPPAELRSAYGYVEKLAKEATT